MAPDEIARLFDQQAAAYDAQQARTAPLRDALYLLLAAQFAELPDDARILCVGAGTGLELAHLAALQPRWRFTAVEPSQAMLALCRQRAEQQGFAARCAFHGGFLESLPPSDAHHGATCLLVSQFIPDPGARAAFFGGIGSRLLPRALLVSADLAADVASPAFAVLLRTWARMMAGGDVGPATVERMRQAYQRDVAVLPPDQVAALIEAGGFDTPVAFFQAGLMHAWRAARR